MDVKTPALKWPHPYRGWSRDLLDLEKAIVVPPEENGFVQQAGVLRADGSCCPRGAMWRKRRPLTVCPQMPKGTLPYLPGTWLWGGQLWGHFGHFITESTSRLWALPDLRGKIDGILFIPKRLKSESRMRSFHSEFLSLFGGEVPIRLLTDPAPVERLFVPGQGFGLGRISAGTEAFRRAMSDHFAHDIRPDGPERLYISRSKIGASRGTIVAEREVEIHLRLMGYEVFHPQDHDISTQLARYKAARLILASEGSALHLVGMVARADQKIGILLRRKSAATKYIATHLHSFTGSPPVVLDSLHREWRPKGSVRKKLWIGEHDMPGLQKALAGDGFIEDHQPEWPSLSIQEVQRLLGEKYELAAEYGKTRSVFNTTHSTSATPKAFNTSVAEASSDAEPTTMQLNAA